MKIGRVAELLELPGRGVAVITDTAFEQLPSELRLKIGDPVELRHAAEVLRTKVVGIEHCDPWSPKQKFCILLPSDVTKDAITIGSEVWSDQVPTA